MPVLDVSNPKVIKFLLENYEKESLIRMKWGKTHGDLFKQAATLTRETKNYTPLDITKSVIEAGMAATTRDHISGASNRLTAPKADFELVKTHEMRKVEIVMKPVTSELKNVLAESSTEYLKKRCRLKPDERYNFIECSSWKYGWKLEESMLKTRGPQYGKFNQVVRESCGRVGPQKDPDHYQNPDPGQKVFESL